MGDGLEQVDEGEDFGGLMVHFHISRAKRNLTRFWRLT